MACESPPAGGETGADATTLKQWVCKVPGQERVGFDRPTWGASAVLERRKW